MTEAVRLVVWDLDETFWQGTLTEGGITYNWDNHNIVIELAKRGIMSSIVSKNDHETIKKILVEKGIWDYFIFPSITWEPKGVRIANLVEAVQLRAPTILFIDDNPMNLNEAKHYTPDLQVADETFIPQILASPLFKGKDDSKLTRLAQYKMLERRKQDEMAAGADNTEFLRTSGIKVFINYDIENNLDRAIELINRTNQLNFTKRRLPEDPEAARQKLRAFIADSRVRVGLVRVADNYGDYGYCGFYAVKGFEGKRLKHYCFSCRILNMGVETWLYNSLGRPDLDVVGEVLLDVVNDKTDVDWIREVTDEAALTKPVDDQPVLLDRLFIRGGCDLGAMSHYVRTLANTVTTEFPAAKDGSDYRTDHSQFFRYALTGRTPGMANALSLFGYGDEEFSTALKGFADGASGRTASILSFWQDGMLRVYKHPEEDVLIPAPHLKAELRKSQVIPEPFVQDGRISEEEFKKNLRLIFDQTRSHFRVFVLGSNEYATDPETGQRQIVPRFARVNRWIRHVIAKYDNIVMVNVLDCVASDAEIQSQTHFDRMVYFRLVERIRALLKEAIEEDERAAERPVLAAAS